MSQLIGYQERSTWMDEEILTLADIWPESPTAMIVGLNPAPTSVEAGHCYQGRAGQGQLRKLAAAGPFALPTGRQFEEEALAAGVGFTDIVKRPTTGEDGVTKAEIAHGSQLLAEKLSARDVKLIVCVFRHPVKALLGIDGAPGMQKCAPLGVRRCFGCPGRTASVRLSSASWRSSRTHFGTGSGVTRAPALFYITGIHGTRCPCPRATPRCPK